MKELVVLVILINIIAVINTCNQDEVSKGDVVMNFIMGIFLGACIVINLF